MKLQKALPKSSSQYNISDYSRPASRPPESDKTAARPSLASDIERQSQEQLAKQRAAAKRQVLGAGTHTGSGFAGLPGRSWGEKPLPPGYPIEEEPAEVAAKEPILPDQVVERPAEGVGPEAEYTDRQQAISPAIATKTPLVRGQRVAPAELEQAQALQTQKQAARMEAEKLSRIRAAKGIQAQTRGRMLAAKLQRAAESGALWPYWYALAVSIFNDLIDFFDLSFGIGFDQILDLGAACLILSSRLFIRGQLNWYNWYIVRFMVFVAELIPGVGIIPFWSITAVIALIRARKTRGQHHLEIQSEEYSQQEELKATVRENRLKAGYRRVAT